MARRRTFFGLFIGGVALATQVVAAERCMVTDPTGTPLNVRRYDGQVIGVLHNGEIIRILRMGADRNGGLGLMSLMRRTEKVGYIESSSVATEKMLMGRPLGERFSTNQPPPQPRRHAPQAKTQAQGRCRGRRGKRVKMNVSPSA